MARAPSGEDRLTLECPYCGHMHSDDYECLESGAAALLRCENPHCRQQFSFVIRECLECAEESIFIWTSAPAPEALALLSCKSCGAPFDEASSEGQDPNAA